MGTAASISSLPPRLDKQAAARALPDSSWTAAISSMFGKQDTISRHQFVNEMRQMGLGVAMKRKIWESSDKSCIFCSLRQRRGLLQNIIAVDISGLASAIDGLGLTEELQATTVIRPPLERPRITCMCLASDYHILYTATEVGIITKWNALTFAQMGTNDTHRGMIHCMRFHSGLQAMISGSADKTVRQWRLEDDRMVGMSLYADEVTCFADEEESATFCVGLKNGLLYRTQTSSGEPQTVFRVHTGAVRDAKVCGMSLVSCADDNTVCWWNLKSGDVTMKVDLNETQASYSVTQSIPASAPTCLQVIHQGHAVMVGMADGAILYVPYERPARKQQKELLERQQAEIKQKQEQESTTAAAAPAAQAGEAVEAVGAMQEASRLVRRVHVCEFRRYQHHTGGVVGVGVGLLRSRVVEEEETRGDLAELECMLSWAEDGTLVAWIPDEAHEPHEFSMAHDPLQIKQEQVAEELGALREAEHRAQEQVEQKKQKEAALAMIMKRSADKRKAEQEKKEQYAREAKEAQDLAAKRAAAEAKKSDLQRIARARAEREAKEAQEAQQAKKAQQAHEAQQAAEPVGNPAQEPPSISSSAAVVTQEQYDGKAKPKKAQLNAILAQAKESR